MKRNALPTNVQCRVLLSTVKDENTTFFHQKKSLISNMLKFQVSHFQICNMLNFEYAKLRINTVSVLAPYSV